MKTSLPSMADLLAFQSLAHHRSFTLAARELCVTQGAISKHLVHLESVLGAKLVTRSTRHMELTEAGLAYLDATHKALSEIELATSRLMSNGGRGGILNLSVPPTFAVQWLFPRLPKFRREMPRVEINFVRYQHAHDFGASHEFDAAIQFGHGEWSNASHDYLIGREVDMVCTPEICRRLELDTLDHLGRATFLQHVEVPYAWPEWLQAHGRGDLNGLAGPKFNQYSLIVSAAISGIGVGLVPSCLVENELHADLLIHPLRMPYSSRNGYYLCAPLSKAHRSAYCMFRQWLLQEIRDLPAVASDAVPVRGPGCTETVRTPDL